MKPNIKRFLISAIIAVLISLFLTAWGHPMILLVAFPGWFALAALEATFTANRAITIPTFVIVNAGVYALIIWGIWSLLSKRKGVV
jgi:hypothetical protein